MFRHKCICLRRCDRKRELASSLPVVVHIFIIALTGTVVLLFCWYMWGERIANTKLTGDPKEEKRETRGEVPFSFLWFVLMFLERRGGISDKKMQSDAGHVHHRMVYRKKAKWTCLCVLFYVYASHTINRDSDHPSFELKARCIIQ